MFIYNYLYPLCYDDEKNDGLLTKYILSQQNVLTQ